MRLSIAVAVACLSIVGASAAEHATAAIKKATNIPAQELGSALDSLAREHDFQVIYLTDLVDKLRTNGAIGVFTTDQAIHKLLDGTGLSYRYLDEKTITVGPAATSSARATNSSDSNTRAATAPSSSSNLSPGTGEEGAAQWEMRSTQEGKSLWQRFRLAQAETASSSTNTSSTSAPSKITLEEVIVTAQRRKEPLQDVPISISVLSGEELDSSSYLGVTDAIRTIPGIDTKVDNYSGGVMFSVRGVSNPVARYGGAGPIAYYVDGVPYGFVRSAFYPDSNIYDLDRIEFLNGPQGTLYGASALNGVMRILTRDANADAFELKTRGAFYSTDGGTDSYRGDVAVNVPLIEGRLGVRAVVGYQYDGGWIDSRPLATGPAFCGPDGYTTDPNVGVVCPNRDDVNDERRLNYRLKLHAQPSDTLSVDLTAWRVDSDTGAPSFSREDQTIRATIAQPAFSNYNTYGATVVKEFPAFSLSSMTSYIDYQSGAVVSGEPPGIRFAGVVDSRGFARVFAQEFNLLSSIEGPWSWSAGAFYRDAKDFNYAQLASDADAYRDPITGKPYRQVLVDFDDTSKSYAVFGGIERRFFNNKLEAAVALRYFHDKQAMSTNSTYPNAGTIVPGVPFEAISEAWTPRAILTWKPTPDQMVYLSYGQGFRSGFAQTPEVQTNVPNYKPVKPDKLTNYEIGTKGSLFGGWLSYEAAAFYIHWKDAPRSVSVYYDNGITTLRFDAMVNDELVRGPGGSLGLTARPLGGLELGANVSCNALENKADGEHPPFSPECTYGASAQYEWALASGFQLSLGISGTYKGRGNGDALIQVTKDDTGELLPIQILQSEEIINARARLAIESSRNWRAMLYADNLTNQYSSPGLIFDSSTTSADWAGRQRPRTLGVQVEYDFK